MAAKKSTDKSEAPNFQLAPPRPDTELAIDTFDICGQVWTFHTTPLRVRFEGKDGDAIANYFDRTITVSLAKGPKMAARVAAKVMREVVENVTAEIRRRHPNRTIKLPRPYPTMPEILPPEGGR